MTFRSAFIILILAMGTALTMGLAGAAIAKDNLGTFSKWAAFRDADTPRCYAIAEPDDTRGNWQTAPYASIGYWPRSAIRGQFYIRLSRAMAEGSRPVLTVGTRRFRLTGNGTNAWAVDKTMDAAIVATIRSARRMTVRTGRLADSYDLAGSATAMDAAALACARNR